MVLGVRFSCWGWACASEADPDSKGRESSTPKKGGRKLDHSKGEGQTSRTAVKGLREKHHQPQGWTEERSTTHKGVGKGKEYLQTLMAVLVQVTTTCHKEKLRHPKSFFGLNPRHYRAAENDYELDCLINAKPPFRK